MAYYVRPMRREDVAQVIKIDREAFPTIWPPPNYQRELNNRLAHYIVTCDSERTAEVPEAKAAPENGFLRLLAKVAQLFSHDRFFGEGPPPSGSEYVVGFAGIWVMADEAHVTNIAVRKRYQCQGIGELLLIHITELARGLKADIMTLEVRVSNTVAQSLYQKYGYTRVGVRRAYYTDNREDGVLMSTENINSEAYQAFFQRLKQAHAGKWRGPPQPC